MVAPFIRWLEDMGMVNLGLVAEETEVGLDSQIRIQKYVYVAQNLGQGTVYQYNRYMSGPFSIDLSNDCERLADNPAEYEVESARSPVPEGFQREEFLRTVKGRSDDWFEVATVLMDISPQHDNTTDMLKHAEWMKGGIYTTEYIKGVFEDLLKSPVRKSVSH